MQNKFLSLSTLILVTLAFNGCGAKSQKGLTPSNKEYIIWEKGNNIYKVSSWTKNRINLKDALNAVAKDTKARGFDSFMILNDGVNNLQGFPIHTYKSLRRYVDIKKVKGMKFVTDGKNLNRGLPLLERMRVESVQIKYKPLNKDLNSFVSVWNADKTINDTK